MTQAKGDCFKANGNFLLENRIEDAELIHAEVSGQGKLEGLRFAHAWIEINGMALDLSNNECRVIPAYKYRELAKVKKGPDTLVEYKLSDLLEKLVSHQHWGPWDLSCSI